MDLHTTARRIRQRIANARPGERAEVDGVFLVSDDSPMTQTASEPATPGLGRNYWRLFTSSTLTNLGDGVMLVAFVWLGSSLTRDPTVLALIALAGRLPWLVFSLPAGVITDRVDRRKLVAWMDVGRFAVIGAFTVVLQFHSAGVPTPEQFDAGAAPPPSATLLLVLLGIASLALGFAEVLRDNGAQTLMPAVVRKDQLEKANGRLWGVEMAMNSFAGQPLGGLLVGVAVAVPFALNAGLLGLSALLVFSLVGANFRPATAAARRPWREELAEGFRWLWRHRLLRTLAILLGAMNLLSGAAFVLIVLFTQEVLHLFEGWQFGLVTTGFAVGAVLGSLLADRVSKRLSPGTALLLAIAGGGACVIAQGLSGSPWLFWIFAVLGGFLMVLWNVITVSLRQRLIPDHLLGRVNSVYRFFGWGTISLGTLLGGLLVALGQPWLGREWALRLPFLVAGGLQIALLGVAATRLTTANIQAAEAAAG